jgi:glutathione S-transferase
MKLVGSQTSPFVRKVRIVLAEKRIDYAFIEDSPWVEETQVPNHNPLGKVPVLILEDNSTLFDSRVIVEYLDMVSPVARLIPEHKREKIKVKRLEALADGVGDAAATIFIEKKMRPPEQQSPEWLERQSKKIRLGCAALSEELGHHTWYHDNTFGLADIAVGAVLGYLDLRFPEWDWRTPYPNLAQLLDEQLEKRNSFKESAPPKTP